MRKKIGGYLIDEAIALNVLLGYKLFENQLVERYTKYCVRGLIKMTAK